MAQWAASPPTAGTRHHTPVVGLTVLAFACLIAATFVAGAWWKLGVLLAISVTWMAGGAARSTTRRAGTWGWAAAGLGGLAFLLGAVGLPVTPYAGPVVRLAVLVVAGRAFALSVSPAAWRHALVGARLPNRVVLLFTAAQAMMGVLASEVRLAREGMRIRATAGTNGPNPLGLHRLWRAGVAFCARLFARADRLAAVAETRAFSRPGRRWTARSSPLPCRYLLAGASCVAATAVLCLV